MPLRSMLRTRTGHTMPLAEGSTAPMGGYLMEHNSFERNIALCARIAPISLTLGGVSSLPMRH